MQMAILWFSCSSFRVFISLGQLVGEKGLNAPNHRQGLFERD